MSAEGDKHEYQGDFFDYINAGSLASARLVCPLVVEWFKPTSLLDVGSGAGAWCKIWAETGVADVVGVDGDYVQTGSLLIPEETFRRKDLSRSFDLERKFDLVTSLEVAEHVPETSSQVFIENLAKHGDIVMFSAAVRGQGGEFHVNEQPLSYWRERFASSGFRCFDPLRSAIATTTGIEPWYRYNTLFYVRDEAVTRIPQAVRDTELKAADPIPEMAPLSWRARNAIIANLPELIVDGLVKTKHAWTRRTRRG